MKIRIALLVAILAGVGAWAAFAIHSAAAQPEPVLKSIADFNRAMVDTSPEFLKSGRLTYQLMTTRGVSRFAFAESLAQTKALSSSAREHQGEIALEFTSMYMTYYHGKKDDAKLSSCLKASSDMFNGDPQSSDFDRDYKACTAH